MLGVFCGSVIDDLNELLWLWNKVFVYTSYYVIGMFVLELTYASLNQYDTGFIKEYGIPTKAICFSNAHIV